MRVDSLSFNGISLLISNNISIIRKLNNVIFTLKLTVIFSENSVPILSIELDLLEKILKGKS